MLSRQVPPRSPAFSNTRKFVQPAFLSWIAMHRPENPAPITATSRSALGGLKGAFMTDNMSVRQAVCKLAVAAAFVAFATPAAAQPGLDIETVVVTASPPEPVGQGAFSSVTLD